MVTWAKGHNYPIVQEFVEIGADAIFESAVRYTMLNPTVGLLLDRLSVLHVDTTTARGLWTALRACGSHVHPISAPPPDYVQEARFRRLLSLRESVRQSRAADTRAAEQSKEERSRRLGDVPLGYKLDSEGTLIPNENERRAARHAMQLRLDGLSYRAIGTQLLSAGYTPRGESWHPTTVLRLLKFGAQLLTQTTTP